MAYLFPLVVSGFYFLGHSKVSSQSLKEYNYKFIIRYTGLRGIVNQQIKINIIRFPYVFLTVI